MSLETMESLEINELRVENAVLRKLASERGRALYEALGALSSMWNQYCPPPQTHMYMTAGEEAEEVLNNWHLLRADETSIYLAGGLVVDPDIPANVEDLLTTPSTQ